jgi:3-dehydroquinate dehydratase II
VNRILVLHGPNLDQLGRRDPEVYGPLDAEALAASIRAAAAELGLEVVIEDHGAEHDLVARVHAAAHDGTAAVIVNPGALGHYSYALRDALELLAVPAIEVHLSNVHGRERFRTRSVIAAVCAGSISGLGPMGYRLALEAAGELARR